MILTRFRAAALLLAATIGTSACTDGYGYGGLSVGYGGGYNDPYYGGYGYGDYGYGYGGPGSYWGWNNGFYYPGTGIYVYDQYRRPHRWNDYQRRYWSERRNNWRGGDGIRENWRDFPNNRGDRRGWGNRDRVRGNGVRGQEVTQPSASGEQARPQRNGQVRQPRVSGQPRGGFRGSGGARRGRTPQ